MGEPQAFVPKKPTDKLSSANAVNALRRAMEDRHGIPVATTARIVRLNVTRGDVVTDLTAWCRTLPAGDKKPGGGG